MAHISYDPDLLSEIIKSKIRTSFKGAHLTEDDRESLRILNDILMLCDIAIIDGRAIYLTADDIAVIGINEFK